MYLLHFINAELENKTSSYIKCYIYDNDNLLNANYFIIKCALLGLG